MKQVFFTSGGVRIEEVPAPVCQDNGVLVRTSYSVISPGTESSDLQAKRFGLREKLAHRQELVNKVKLKINEVGIGETYKTVKERLSNELLTPTGYSLSGIIIEKGRLITDLNVGDRVACGGSKVANHAEIVSVPRNLAVKIPNNVEYKEAAFATLGSIAMQGVRRAGATFGETVVILGLGLVGLLSLQIAKAAGCKVVGIDLDESRVDVARGLETNLALSLSGTNVESEVLDYTKGMGADAVIICGATKSDEPSNQAMRMCRKKGRVVVVGEVGMNLQREYMYEKELDFVISTSYGPGRYDKLYEEKGIDYPYGYVRWTENRNMEEFLNMVSGKKVNVEKLISLEFPIVEAPKAYEAITDHKPKPLGVVLRYPNFQSPCHISYLQRKVFINNDAKRQKSKNDAVNIAVIGAGKFSESVHLPNLKKIKGYNLKAIVCQHAERAKVLAKRFGAEYATTDFKEVLVDDGVDAVLIATRHNLHAPMTIEAAKAGKHVFVEKPMVLNPEELKQVQEIIGEAGAKYAVGFNRRYSSLSMEAKDLLSAQKKPFLINYRVNAGFVPKDSWLQDPVEGGGRIIGECCHFFDLFNFFIDSEVIEIDAKGVPINSKNIVADDNLVATVKYKDGSLAVLTYVALGNRKLSKERIEIFSNGCSMVIDDFEKLELYGFARKGTNLNRQDKGQYNEMVEFLKQVQGKSSTCLKLSEAISASEITFKVCEKLNNAESKSNGRENV